MAKKRKNVTEIQDVELQPQVIGYSYKKKSNLGRVIFIFIAFVLVVYYINDISVFVNNLIGKKTSDTIEDLTNDTEKDTNTVTSLVCIKDEDNISYKFVNSELTNVVHTVTKNNLSGTEEVNNAKSKVESLKNALGVKANVEEFTNGYKLSIEIDLENADLTKFKDERYFSYKEKMASISSTMTSKGYNCN